MNAHTPGPWTVSAERREHRVRYVTNHHDMIATVHGNADEAWQGDMSTHVDVDARLIAKAPEMLATLAHAVLWGEGFATTSGHTPPWLAEARALLKEIEG